MQSGTFFEVEKSSSKSFGVDVDVAPFVLKRSPKKLDSILEDVEKILEDASKIKSASNELDSSSVLREIAESLANAGKDILFEILSGKTSLKLYLAFKYPHRFRMESKEEKF